MTHTPCPNTLGGDRFDRNPLFWGKGLTLRALGSKTPARKLLLRSKVGPENFEQVCQKSEKLRQFFTMMDRHTHRNKPPHFHYRKRFFCKYVRGKEGNTMNPKKFLPLLFMKNKSLVASQFCYTYVNLKYAR